MKSEILVQPKKESCVNLVQMPFDLSHKKYGSNCTTEELHVILNMKAIPVHSRMRFPHCTSVNRH